MSLALVRRDFPELLVLVVALLAASVGCSQAAEAGSPTNSSRGPSRGGQAIPLDSLFDMLDKDRDGRISREEATGAYAQRFPQWDVNGDGFATRQEIHDFRLRLGIGDDGLRTAGSATSGTNAPPTAGDNPRDRRGAQGGQRRSAATANAAILKEPLDWRLETMAVPPGFAPDIKLIGSEEIRFAPGMFDTGSSNYFTCVIAILAEGSPELGTSDIKDFLEKYYRGLSTGVGRRKGFSPDTAQMQAVVRPALSVPDSKNRFVAEVVFFDSFSDGRKITLNVEGRVIPMRTTKQTLLLLLVSPSSKETAAWRALTEIANTTESSVLRGN